MRTAHKRTLLEIAFGLWIGFALVVAIVSSLAEIVAIIEYFFLSN